MSFIWTLFRWSLSLLFFLFLLGALAGVGLYVYMARDLPKLEGVSDYRPLAVTEVYDRSGAKIGEFWKERRLPLPYENIPPLMVKAMISSEDNRFFEHSGIDYMGILRAMIENARAGHVVQGGSTITQQIVKSLLLTPERSYTRKIKEAMLSKQIEENFTKEEILYLYLTQTYFGNRAYGIEAAAENYFHKTLAEATLPEMAMLAGLPKAPSKFSPLVDPKRAVERQTYVLDRMVGEGYVTGEEAEAAKHTALMIYTAGTDKDYNALRTPWFTEHVRRLLVEKYGDDRVYAGGLKVYTTLDAAKEEFADRAVKHGLRAVDKREGYKGPLRRVAKEEVADTCRDLGRQALDKNPPPLILDPEAVLAGAPLSPPGASLSLKDDTLYLAVVTAVDDAKQTIGVCHGEFAGEIRHEDFKWARRRDFTTPGWEGNDYLSKPSAMFQVGDVIEVALKPKNPETQPVEPSGGIRFVLEQTPEVEGSLVSYEPESGDVVAMIGGYDFGRSEFNRAVQAIRQPGSSFKPIVYTSAVLKGYKPTTIVYDSPITFEGAAGKPWSPQNYGNKYFGAIPLANALAKSLNTVSVRLVVALGTDFVTAVARTLGITTPIERYYPMALGANGLYLIELARAYGPFATGGILPDLHFITRIEDDRGAVIEDNAPRNVVPFTDYFSSGAGKSEKPELVETDVFAKTTTPLYAYDFEGLGDTAEFNSELYLRGLEFMNKEGLKLRPIEQYILFGRYIPPGYTINPQVAYTMRDLLAGVVDHGTAVRAKALKRPAAGKTGTTNNETDTWFIGFVPELLTGAWVGFDDQRQTVGAKETGGKTALPIWMEYMDKSLAGTPPTEFSTPPEALVDFYSPSRQMLHRMRIPGGEEEVVIDVLPDAGDETSPFEGDAASRPREPAKPGEEPPLPSSRSKPKLRGPTADDNFFSTEF